MRVIDHLNNLQAAGLLLPLYRAGLVPIRAYTYREVYLTYAALRCLPRYTEHLLDAARETAQQCGVNLSTVYRARELMEQPLPTTAAG